MKGRVTVASDLSNSALISALGALSYTRKLGLLRRPFPDQVDLCENMRPWGPFLVFLAVFYFLYLFIKRTLVSLGYVVDTVSTKFDLCEFKLLFKDPMKDFLAASLVFVF